MISVEKGLSPVLNKKTNLIKTYVELEKLTNYYRTKFTENIDARGRIMQLKSKKDKVAALTDVSADIVELADNVISLCMMFMVVSHAHIEMTDDIYKNVREFCKKTGKPLPEKLSPLIMQANIQLSEKKEE